MPDGPQQPEIPGVRPTRNKPAWAVSAGSDDELPFSEQPLNSERIWAAAVPTSGRPATPRAMITKLFGRNSRGGPDTKTAADQLGVSQRTVQKWIHNRRTPTSSGGDQLRTQYQGWQHTPAGRKSTLGRKNRDRLLSTRRITFSGTLAVSGDVRKRNSMEIEVANPQLMANLVDQLGAGDDPGTHRALEDLIGDPFGGDVSVRIDKIEFQ